MHATENFATHFKSRWAYAPWLLLGALLSIQAVLYTLSTSDGGVSVEPDYYAKAVNWDAQRLQERKNGELGYSVKFNVKAPATPVEDAIIQLSLLDRQSAPLERQRIALSAFPNARASQIQELKVTEVAPGIYSGPFQLTRAGIWEFRLSVERGSTLFTHKQQVELALAP